MSGKGEPAICCECPAVLVLAAAKAGPAAPIVTSEDRKFFRFILSFRLILLRLKLLLIRTCVLYWQSHCYCCHSE